MTINDSELTLSDQMLDDLAGEEFNDFEVDYDLGSDLDIATDIDDFTMIDSYH